MNAVLEQPLQEWQQRLSLIVETMRDMSRHTDPQEIVRAYSQRIGQLLSVDRRISLSRRDLAYPRYRITRSTTWAEEINPWMDRDRLPLFEGGLLADFIYGNETQVVNDLALPAGEPAAEYLSGHRSLLAIPNFDQGESLNMVVLMQREPAGFPREQIPDLVWRSNLFGRATNTLVLKDELQRAYQALDRELKMVGEIQRSLLPTALPKIPSLDLAAYYQPSHRAGGDYYDFFSLPDGNWGIFIADVSGHGTPAAVLMAVTHSMAHTHPGPALPPGRVLEYLNHHLATRYTDRNGDFVTAFYGIYDPSDRRLTYASAGHNPPRLKRCQDGTLLTLAAAAGFPLGVDAGETYPEAVWQLQKGDQVVFYTDGVTEARNPSGEMYGTRRLDRALATCGLEASALLDSVLRSLEDFAAGHPADDDRTLVVGRVR